MAEKRLFILCSPEEHAKRQRHLGIPAKVEQLELLWVTDILPRFKSASSVLGLASTCRFFRDLYAQQPSTFWHQLCKKYYWNEFVFSSHVNYRDIFISATLVRCVVCHGHEWESAMERDETTWMMYLHKDCVTPIPIVSVSKATKDYHLPKKLVQKLPDVRPGANPRYFVADVLAAAYAHCGSKEKWEEKHAKLLNQREATKNKQPELRRAEIKKEVDRVVVDLGPEFQFERWSYYGIDDYISNGPDKTWSKTKKRQHVQELVQKELKHRLKAVIAKQQRKDVTVASIIIDTECIRQWLGDHPEKLPYFPQYHVYFQ